MKKYLILTLTGMAMLSCSKDKHVVPSNNCGIDPVISAYQYANAPSDPLTINSLKIENNCLKIQFSAGGCNGKTWQVKLIDSENILESNPPQRNLKLSLKNEEPCEAYIKKEIAFDISKLQVEGNKVLLNITNSDKQILYEY